jgi:OOP family OmpA-OmpF porin
MKRTYSIFFASFLFFSSSPFTTSWGQSKPQAVTTTAPVSLTIEGTIVDDATRDPVAGATISAKNQSGTFSDKQRTGQDGTYQLVLRNNEAFHLSVVANGYEPYDQELAPTSAYTNKISKLISLYRLGSKPVAATTNPVVSASSSPKPAKTDPAQTASSTSSTTSTPPVTLPTVAVTSNRSAGSSVPAPTERLTPPKTLDAKVTYTPPLVVAPKGKATQLRALQFVQSKSELLADAQPMLDQLLQFMQQHPTAEIELAGHTDNQGDFDKNVELSKERVEVVKAYLVQSGISASRITTRGYGPTRPIANNSSEATRKLNRRVEMIVVKQ